MKKLKTWQIVLLVIFYPVGICVWIYRAIKRSQLKKAREAEQAALSARREAEPNARNSRPFVLKSLATVASAESGSTQIATMFLLSSSA